jgi:hypothetical protein
VGHLVGRTPGGESILSVLIGIKHKVIYQLRVEVGNGEAGAAEAG